MDSLRDPGCKDIWQRGVDDVAEPLLWQLLPLLLHGQVVEALWVLCDEVLNLLHAEGLILWEADVLDGV